MAKIGDIQDDFTTTISTQWNANFGGPTIDTTNQRAQLPLVGVWCNLGARYYDAVESAVAAQLTPPPIGNGTNELYMQVFLDSNNNASWVWSGGQFRCEVKDSGATVGQTFVPYSSHDHAWWKISETLGQFLFWTSADGVGWTLRAQIPHSWTANSVTVQFQAGWYGAEANSNAYVDNVNIAPVLGDANTHGFTGRGAFPYRATVAGSRAAYPTVRGDDARLIRQAFQTFMLPPVPRLVATPDSDNARIRLNLSWPHTRFADIYRVQNGVQTVLPGYTQVPVNETWVGYDDLCPLDTVVSYVAVSSYGEPVATGSVTLDSQAHAWLKHPGRPELNTQLLIKEWQPKTQAARRGQFDIMGQSDQIVVADRRGPVNSTIVLQTLDSLDDVENLTEMLQDGQPLLLQAPAVWGGDNVFISVGDIEVARTVSLLAVGHRTITLPYVEAQPVAVSQAHASKGTRFLDYPEAWQDMVGSWDDQAIGV